MSDTAIGNMTCPGRAAVLDDTGYLMINTIVFYQNAMPNGVSFFMTEAAVAGYQFRPFMLSTVNQLNADLLTLMHANEASSALRVKYLGMEVIQLSDTDVVAEGWHVITGPIVPPIPLTPTPDTTRFRTPTLPPRF